MTWHNWVVKVKNQVFISILLYTKSILAIFTLITDNSWEISGLTFEFRVKLNFAAGNLLESIFQPVAAALFRPRTLFLCGRKVTSMPNPWKGGLILKGDKSIRKFFHSSIRSKLCMIPDLLFTFLTITSEIALAVMGLFPNVMRFLIFPRFLCYKKMLHRKN